MAIFGNQNSSSYVTAPVVIEGYTSAIDGDVIAYQEFIEDMATVYESVHAADMLEIELRKSHNGATLESVMESASDEYGRFEVAMEAALSNIWERIKASIKKLWAKIKGFFKSVRKYFDYLIMDSTKFAKTYEKDLRRKSGLIGGMEVEIHSYNDAIIDNKDFKIYDAIMSSDAVDIDLTDDKNAAEALAELKKDGAVEECMDELRAQALGKSGKISKEDWTEELYGYFRGGEKTADDKKTVKGPDVMAMCKVLQETKIISKFVGIEKAMDKSFNDLLKSINDGSKAAANDGKKELVQLASLVAANVPKAHAIGTSFIKGWEKAAKERNRVYKSVCMKALTYKQKDN